MSLQLYKVIHLTGIAMMLFALGGLCFHALGGGEKKHDGRRGMMMTHGIGLLLTLVAGFGMLAHLGIHWPWPTWVLLKAVIWLAFGLVTLLLYRSGGLNRVVAAVSILLLTAAAVIVQYKTSLM